MHITVVDGNVFKSVHSGILSYQGALIIEPVIVALRYSTSMFFFTSQYANTTLFPPKQPNQDSCAIAHCPVRQCSISFIATRLSLQAFSVFGASGAANGAVQLCSNTRINPNINVRNTLPSGDVFKSSQP